MKKECSWMCIDDKIAGVVDTDSIRTDQQYWDCHWQCKGLRSWRLGKIGQCENLL